MTDAPNGNGYESLFKDPEHYALFQEIQKIGRRVTSLERWRYGLGMALGVLIFLAGIAARLISVGHP